MGYKDKDRQREANRRAAKKYRDSMTDKSMTVAPEIIPKSDIRVIPKPDIVDILHQRVLANPKVKLTPKRGKDIQCFEDLPPDVQRTIEYMSIDAEGIVNIGDKARRAAIAIHYQHLFPDRYYSTGLS